MKPLPSDLHLTRLGDWHYLGIHFKALCPKCHSERQVPPQHVLKRLGQEWRYSEDRMKELPKVLSLVCGSCGNKEGISVRLVRE